VGGRAGLVPLGPLLFAAAWPGPWRWWGLRGVVSSCSPVVRSEMQQMSRPRTHVAQPSWEGGESVRTEMMMMMMLYDDR
jgi:hypothetical protein